MRENLFLEWKRRQRRSLILEMKWSGRKHKYPILRVFFLGRASASFCLNIFLLLLLLLLLLLHPQLEPESKEITKIYLISKIFILCLNLGDERIPQGKCLSSILFTQFHSRNHKTLCQTLDVDHFVKAIKQTSQILSVQIYNFFSILCCALGGFATVNSWRGTSNQ